MWILDALRYTPHPSHLSVEQALAWIARMKPKRAVLTHMHVDLDYETLGGELPEGVEPAYDGMVLTTKGEGTLRLDDLAGSREIGHGEGDKGLGDLLRASEASPGPRRDRLRRACASPWRRGRSGSP